MQNRHLTPEQKSRFARRKERRRQQAALRAEELRRRRDRLRRQIADARRRRQRMLMLLLLAILAMKQAILTAISYSITYRLNPTREPKDWAPDPGNDFAPHDHRNEYCDGYSYAQWSRMLKERGLSRSRKAERQKAWQSEPDYHLFPLRYREWGHRPYIGQVMQELTAPYWQQDALEALKLLTPPEVHTYLDEAYAVDLRELRQCFGDRDADIIRAFQNRAVMWEQRKQQEAEQARKAKHVNKPEDDSNGLAPGA
ncbi:hypothetical protein [Agrobacterium tumefaciens]|uniref:hypothetical protein n=1 Tax=Agrobacterium tumefaciens TaxID=358 RepID=UPI001FA950FE|nr:hypothetical protein [Agrobacterium tumefaciens]UNZ52847.1 hypothetical protein MLE07_18905 [Agrobacterium tumefaciens]